MRPALHRNAQRPQDSSPILRSELLRRIPWVFGSVRRFNEADPPGPERLPSECGTRIDVNSFNEAGPPGPERL